jgi:hypothetical protein
MSLIHLVVQGTGTPKDTGCVLLIDKTRSKQKNYVCRCDERLKGKTEGSTRLTYT